jgi:hypothetical protein
VFIQAGRRPAGASGDPRRKGVPSVKQTGIRTYEVKADDFPLTVLIAARGLDVCTAVVSDVHIVRDGLLVAQTPVAVTSDDGTLSKRYDIKKPSQAPGADLVQMVNGWFGKRAPEGARYDITITSALGDAFKTSIGVPTIDPGIANLTFQYR